MQAKIKAKAQLKAEPRAKQQAAQELEVTVLGCGTSCGVPRVGGVFGACDPNEPKNHRMRSSLFLESRYLRQAQQLKEKILIDCGPDVRRQLLDNSISDFDGVFFTHAHADHFHGIDELRWIMRDKLRCITDKKTYQHLCECFGYAMNFDPDESFYRRPVMEFEDVENGVYIGDEQMNIQVLNHGFGTALGFYCGGLAYSCDVVDMTRQQLEEIQGVPVWIVDCLGHKPHPTHAHLARVLEWIEIVQPSLALFTHMGLDMDYNSIRRELPDTVRPAYDGLNFTIRKLDAESKTSNTSNIKGNKSNFEVLIEE